MTSTVASTSKKFAFACRTALTSLSTQSDIGVSPFDTRGPSLLGKELMRGLPVPNKRNGPLVTTNVNTTRLIHELRPARKGNI